MGIPSRIGRYAVREQSGSWGTEEGVGEFVNADFLEAEITIPAPAQESVAADTMRQNYYAPTRVAGGLGVVEVSMKLPLHGFSTATPAANPTEHPDAVLLRSVLGASSIRGYQAAGVATPSGTSSVVNITTGVNADVGQLLAFPISGGHSLGWVTGFTDGAPDTYTLLRALSAAATAGGTILGSQTAYLTTTQPTPFTVQWLGADARVAFRLVDCVVTGAKLTLSPRQQPTLEVTIRASRWLNDGTGGAAAAVALTNRPQMPVQVNANGARMVDSTGSLPLFSCEIEMAAEVTDQLEYGATNGIGRFHVGARTVKVMAEAPAAPTGVTSGALDDITSLTAPGASDGSVQIDANTTAGRALSIIMPVGQHMELQKVGDRDRLVSLVSVYEPGFWGSDTNTGGGVASAPGNTAFRIGFA